MTRLALVATLTLALVAFGAGPLLYQDQTDRTISCEALRRLKTQLAAPYKVRPLVLQVTDAHMTGDTPDHVEGTAVWRTLFGIPVGEPQFAATGGHYDLDVSKWMAVWTIFLVTEGLLGSYVLYRGWQE